METFPPARQRPKLRELLDVMDARPDSLRRDACGDWSIAGRRGHVYALQGGFQLVFTGQEGAESAQRWTYAKRRMPNDAKLTQDGDFDGTLILPRLPTPAEAAELRTILGIYQAKHYGPPSDVQVAHRVAFGERARREAAARAMNIPPSSVPEEMGCAT